MTPWRGLYSRLRPPAPYRLGDLRSRCAVVDGETVEPAVKGGDRFVRIARSELRPPPPALLTTDPAVVAPHYAPYHGSIAGPTGEVGCYVLADALYDVGAGVPVAESGDALLAEELVAPHWRADLERGALIPPRRKTARALDAVCVAAATPYALSYGFFLLHTLPCVLLARRMLGAAWPAARVLLHGDSPAWVGRILAANGVTAEQCLFIPPGHGRVRARRLIVPTPMHTNYRYHSFASGIFDSVPGEAAAGAPRRLYFPREENLSLRRFANEHAVLPIARALGFAISRPWLLPWAAQVSLFRGAEVMASAFGSVLHNALFAPPETRVVAFGWVNQLQSGIAGLRGQRMALVQPAEERAEAGGLVFTVSPEAARMGLEAALAG